MQKEIDIAIAESIQTAKFEQEMRKACDESKLSEMQTLLIQTEKQLQELKKALPIYEKTGKTMKIVKDLEQQVEELKHKILSPGDSKKKCAEQCTRNPIQSEDELLQTAILQSLTLSAESKGIPPRIGVPRKSDEVTGITNLGNTCFVNGILQVLLNSFHAFDHRMQCANRSNCLMCDIVGIYKEYNLGYVSENALRKVINPLAHEMKRKDYGQEDASEFLTFLFDKLSASEHGRKLIDLFSGMNRMGEKFTIIQPSVGSYRSIAEIINSYQETKHVTKFPMFVPIHVHRLDERGNKHSRYIEISDMISIGGVPYRLSSAVAHTGQGYARGHYISFMRKGEKWFKADDLEIFVSNLQEVDASFPCVLLYEKFQL
jgi:hypothetical protein